MDNMSIWSVLGKTDPKHTKGFSRAGGFKGTAVKPMWVMQRLTEQFGPCGIGWGVGEPKFQIVTAGSEVLVYCTVSAWHGDDCNTIWGVGGDKVSTSRQSGMFNDDEAFKKAFTDAIMNAFKFIGVAADVHMGRFDDNKYVQEVTADFADKPAQKNPNVSVDNGGPDWWGAQGGGEVSAYAIKKNQPEVAKEFDDWMGVPDHIHTAVEWKEWCAKNDAAIKKLPKSWRQELRAVFEIRGKELGALPND